MDKYNIIFEYLQNEVNSGNITLELADSVNDLAYEKYVVEGAITRSFSRSDNNSKANTVLKVWGKSEDLPSEEIAKKRIDKLEKASSPHISLSDIKAMAVINYPQSSFIKILNKSDDGKTPKRMLQPANINDDSDIASKAMKYWIDKKFKIVCPSGGGDYLIYSISTGKFYDFFHEEDFADNYKEWMKSGITYKDLMKKIKGDK